MNLPAIKSGLFRTVLFANKPNKLKAAKCCCEMCSLKSINDVKMWVCSKQTWQKMGLGKGTWALCFSEALAGLPRLQMEPLRIPQGLLSFLSELREQVKPKTLL